MNIIGKRYLFFALSLIIIIPGLLILAINGLPLALDFTGGSLLEIKLASGELPQPAQVVSIYALQGIQDAQVQTTSSNTLIIRSSFIEDSNRETIINAMEEEFGSAVEVVRLDSVGPTIGAQVASRAALAVAVAALVVVAYITWAFRGVEHAFRYGVSAITAMIHDVLDRNQCCWHWIRGRRLGNGRALPDRLVDRHRFLGAGQDRRVRSHPGKQPAPAQIGIRKTRQPFHCPDTSALDQYPIDDRGIPSIGVGHVRRHHPAGIFCHPVGGVVEWNLLFHFHRRPHSRRLGEQGMAELVWSWKEQNRSIRTSITDKKRT